MTSFQIERSISIMTDFLRNQRESRLNHAENHRNPSRLGAASLALVGELAEQISAKHARAEASLTAVLQKLDAEEMRTQELENRISQANSATIEAEVWLTRITDSLELKLGETLRTQRGTSLAA